MLSSLSNSPCSFSQQLGANAPGICSINQQLQSMPQPLSQQPSFIHLHPMPPPTHSTPLPNPRHQFMILRVRRLLIEHLKWFPVQLCKFSLEAHPIHPRNIVPVIILQKQRQVVCIPKLSPLNRQLLDVIGLGDCENLRGLEIRGRGEVEVVSVVVNFEGFGTAVGGRGTN